MRYQAVDFTIETPNDWEDRSIVSFAAPSSVGDFAPNLVITREAVDLETSIEEYAHRQFDIAQQEVAGLQIITQKNTTLGGRPAVEIVQKLSAHGLNLQQIQMFVLLRREICVITCTATVGSFVQHQPCFQAVLDSFSFTD